MFIPVAQVRRCISRPRYRGNPILRQLLFWGSPDSSVPFVAAGMRAGGFASGRTLGELRGGCQPRVGLGMRLRCRYNARLYLRQRVPQIFL